MRHLASFLFGLVLAPVIWFLAALGQFRLTQALPADGGERGSLVELSLGALLMAAGGLWLGLLLGTRMSPLGPGIAGLVWLGLGVAFVLDVDTVLNTLPNGPSGQAALYKLPLRGGYAFLIGLALLVPLFSPTRWRGRVDDYLDSDDEPKYVPFGPIEDPAGLYDSPNGRGANGDRADAPRSVGRVASPTGEVPLPPELARGRRSATGDVARQPRQ